MAFSDSLGDIVRLRHCLHSGYHDLENNLLKVIVTVLILGVNIGISNFGSTHPLICILLDKQPIKMLKM